MDAIGFDDKIETFEKFNEIHRFVTPCTSTSDGTLHASVDEIVEVVFTQQTRLLISDRQEQSIQFGHSGVRRGTGERFISTDRWLITNTLNGLT